MTMVKPVGKKREEKTNGNKHDDTKPNFARVSPKPNVA